MKLNFNLNWNPYQSKPSNHRPIGLQFSTLNTGTTPVRGEHSARQEALSNSMSVNIDPRYYHQR